MPAFKPKFSGVARFRSEPKGLRLPWVRLVGLGLGLFMAVGVVYAYFTSQDVSADLVFKTGSLKIELVNPSQLEFVNLVPGEEQVVEYSVKNVGSMPVYLKGKFTGGWIDANLDNFNLRPIKLEYRLDSGDWQTLVSNGPALDVEYFYSNDNTETSLIELPTDQTVYWRATFKLANEVNDSYQNQEYKVQIHLVAKQVDDAAGWPEEY